MLTSEVVYGGQAPVPWRGAQKNGCFVVNTVMHVGQFDYSSESSAQHRLGLGARQQLPLWRVSTGALAEFQSGYIPLERVHTAVSEMGCANGEWRLGGKNTRHFAQRGQGGKRPWHAVRFYGMAGTGLTRGIQIVLVAKK